MPYSSVIPEVELDEERKGKGVTLAHVPYPASKVALAVWLILGVLVPAVLAAVFLPRYNTANTSYIPFETTSPGAGQGTAPTSTTEAAAAAAAVTTTTTAAAAVTTTTAVAAAVTTTTTAAAAVTTTTAAAAATTTATAAAVVETTARPATSTPAATATATETATTTQRLQEAKWFCKHDENKLSFYDDCSVCLTDPICCDSAVARVSTSGRLRCTESESISAPLCPSADYPSACGVPPDGGAAATTTAAEAATTTQHLQEPKWFCKHDESKASFYEDCSVCLTDPICCDSAVARVSASGLLRCTEPEAINSSACAAVADYPGACGVDRGAAWFCRHDSRLSSFYDDCSVCLEDPICCKSAAAAATSSGHFRCTASRAVNASECPVADYPEACNNRSALCPVMFCDEECAQQKAFFATSISRETGKYFPYWYCPDYAASLDTYQPDVETMVVVLHGGANNGDTYLCRAQNSVRVHFGDDYHKVGVISLQFNSCYRDGKPDCNEQVDPESISDELYWKHSWYFGANSTANFSKEISSFAVMDELFASFAGNPHFPRLKRIKVLGYSGGANFFVRYSVFGNYFAVLSAAGLDIEFFLGGMPHAAYFDRVRPVIRPIEMCDSGPGGYCVQEEIDAASYAFANPGAIGCRYNHWPFGLEGGLNHYMQQVDTAAAIEAFRDRKVTIFLGGSELCNTFTVGVNNTCYQSCSRNAKTKMTAGSAGSVSPAEPETTASPQPAQREFAQEWLDLYQESQDGPSYWEEWEHYEACAVDLQGHCHYMKQKTWAQYLSAYYGGVHGQRAVLVPTTHDGCATWQSPIARQAIFGDTDACSLQ